MPDVFGLNRRTVESLQAQQDVARYETAATYNTLVANVVVTAIQQASIDAQIEATRALVDDGNRMLRILQYQYDRGYASGVDLAAQKAQLAAVAATLPPLIKQQAQLANLMATLVGRYPSEAPPNDFTLGEAHTCRRTYRSASPRRWWRSARIYCRPRPICTRPAPISASRSPTGCRISSSPRLPATARWNSANSSPPAPISGASARRSPPRSSRAERCCIRSAPRAPPMTRRPSNIAAPC